jgi:hypothetical protein
MIAMFSESLTSLRSENPELDYLLMQVAEAVQLTPTQYSDAEKRYTSVGEWLGAEGSPLEDLAPTIYPQGSMALGTTVRPRGEVEHDLDLVCQATRGDMSAMDLYAAVRDRLAKHATYGRMLKEKKRCICLEYAGEFHLDIVPAVPDATRGGTCILVPDKDLEHWTPSNPLGYVGWFKKRSVQLLLERMMKADMKPLPPQREVEAKPPLAIAVQLLKRARDVVFDGDEDAPRSVLITTLAGLHYPATPSVIATMVQVLRAIRTQIDAAVPEHIVVANPTNPAEKFTDNMTKERYDALKNFVAFTGSKIADLQATRGIPTLQVALEELFGVKPVSAALKKYGELLKSSRDSGTLTYTTSGLSVVGAATGTRVPRNTYFGE